MDLDRRADKLARLIEARLDAGGTGLEAKVAHAGRRLPKYLRRELGYIVEAMRMQASPRLSRQIDWARVERAFAAAERYLRRVDPWDRRRGIALDWLAGNAFNLLIVAALVAAVIAWRGL
ncbi:hypothetical protein [Sinisalibacter lacisalsi]|uniref:Uncharacterized protein n=1 Tax=Sinisalibacter lacisalsi TaxID=1526570 RepID=A0ABQ1QI36_9RHOB|nr:hypothetical protein [Sinisalibacter lacisalsi]GGD26201.1 hypothetical protein GCM10011358_08320 [Sinisalibacter lacisalsi]